MVPFGVPNFVRHPSKNDPKSDPNLEKDPCGIQGVRAWALCCRFEVHGISGVESWE